MPSSSEQWWSKGSRSLSLDGTTLNAELPDDQGGKRRSSIDLDKCISATKDGTSDDEDFESLIQCSRLPFAPAAFQFRRYELKVLAPGLGSGELRWISKGPAEGGKWGKNAYLGMDTKDGPVLKEMVRNDNGVYTRNELPLADRIKYENGELKFMEDQP